MRDIIIHIFHPEMKRISDRSARQILKTLSVSVRQAQAAELRRFIFDLDLPEDRLQSMSDQMDAPIKQTPSYDVEELRRGSMFLTVLVSVSVLGAFVRVAVKTLRTEEQRRDTLTAFKAYLDNTWAPSIVDRVLADLRDRGLGARSVVEDSSVEERDDATFVSIDARTETDDDDHPIPREDNFTVASLGAFVETEIRDAGGPQ